MKKLLIPLAILTLLIIGVFFIAPAISTINEPPIYNPADLNPALVDLNLQGLDQGHRVKDFSLINQNGDTITQEDYKSTIYVADFFFTRCPSICPVMTNNMERLQKVFLADNDVKLLSISVTPVIDSVPVLYNYASRNGANAPKWNITTGNKKHIYDLARKSYFAVVNEGDGGLQDFIHTPNFVLVDKKKQLRGIYDGTKEDEITRLISDIRRLQH